MPENYMKDAKGRLIPLDMIKPVDMQRNDLVLEIVGKARQVSDILAKFKAETFGVVTF